MTKCTLWFGFPLVDTKVLENLKTKKTGIMYMFFGENNIYVCYN